MSDLEKEFIQVIASITRDTTNTVINNTALRSVDEFSKTLSKLDTDLMHIKSAYVDETKKFIKAIHDARNEYEQLKKDVELAEQVFNNTFEKTTDLTKLLQDELKNLDDWSSTTRKRLTALEDNLLAKILHLQKSIDKQNKDLQIALSENTAAIQQNISNTEALLKCGIGNLYEKTSFALMQLKEENEASITRLAEKNRMQWKILLALAVVNTLSLVYIVRHFL